MIQRLYIKDFAIIDDGEAGSQVEINLINNGKIFNI